MMIHRMIPVFALLASPAMAEVVPMNFIPMDDGVAIEDETFDATPTSYDDIIAMADLDGDPTVLSDKEREMIALLAQVLGVSPITN